MKKHVFKGALGLALALLTACTPAASSNAPCESVPPESAVQQPAAVPAADAGPLTFYGLEDGSGNGRGYYEILMREGKPPVLTCTDFEAAQRTVLCEQPGCAHTDENCSAFVQITTSRPRLLALDDRLVLVHGRVPALGQTPAVPARVEVREMDGTGSRTVFTFGANEDVGLYFAADKKHLYALIRTLSDGGSVLDARLLRVELDSGAVENLAQLGNPQDNILVVGVFQNHVVMKRIYEGGWSRQLPTDNWEQKISSQIHSLFFVDENGQEQRLFQWQQFQSVGFVFDQCCYVFDKDGELHKADFLTGEDTVLASFGPEWGTDFVDCPVKIGDTLILEMRPEGTLPGQVATRRFAVNTVDGTQVELPQQTLLEGWQQPVPILYADDRRVLTLWENGQYGLMDTSDFLAGSDAYLPVPLAQ